MANEVYLKEAFRALRLLEEDEEDIDPDKNTFNLKDDNVFDDMEDFDEEGEIEDDTEVDVADLDAEEEEDLQDSYIGQVILECNICHSLIYKKPEDITQGEDEECVNEEDECPFCMGMSGYKIVGQVADYNPEPEISDDELDIEEIDDTPADEEGIPEDIPDAEPIEDEEEPVEESLNEELLSAEINTDSESFSINTDENGGVSISASPAQEEVIAPVSTTMEGDINLGIADNAEIDLNPPTEEEPMPEEGMEDEEIPEPTEDDIVPADEGGEEESPEEDVEIEDFDENEFDNEFGESLKSRFNNVQSYITESIENRDGKLFIEGIITFKSGSKKATHFELRPKTITHEGVVKFLARNKELKETYMVSGKVSKKKLITESMKIVKKKGATK